MIGTGSNFDVELQNACREQKDHCLNCKRQFMKARPNIHHVVVTKRFFKNLKDKENSGEIVVDVLDCSTADFYEPHKFEEHIAGCIVFRTKKELRKLII